MAKKNKVVRVAITGGGVDTTVMAGTRDEAFEKLGYVPKCEMVSISEYNKVAKQKIQDSKSRTTKEGE